ncbi:unnamed protein product [Eruca vesicaria subsp. sativa]|uniref:LsmAD domain-containing protein n=1 Tax=Eruca vesicaria subsp. sativa TaxID=29727 RepID=A0ABC8IY95_ERUVS|nr:unnamed protein product [Eruca vesicaria subsp. sativa]
MNNQSLSNGYPYRKVEHQAGMNKAQPMKPHTQNKNGGKAGSLDIPSRDPFEYLATCHIGHHVEVHLIDGSVYGGIFHSSDVENSFGIVLKMASLIREGSLRGMKPVSPLVSKPPSKILIIPAAEVVQVIAKDLPVHSNNASNSAQCEGPLELLTDSSISQSYHVDLERELKRWVPDEDVPDCSDLENVFDDPWKRGWNQFEVNETLFGVTSTFDEELYTTKLERGPRNRELEEQASKIAREIEGENTRDLHVAEERGIQLSGKFDMDEETKYSSVCPVNGFDDSGYEEDEEEEILLNCRNNLTFGDSTASDGMKTASIGKVYEESWGGGLPSRQPMFEQPSKDTHALGNNNRNENQFGEQRNNKSLEASHYKKHVLTQPSVESVSGLEDINEGAATSDPWRTSDKAKSEKILQTSSPSSRPILSPSSSIGSYSSEKSTLNPNAKEFKPNPNAKSFKQSPTATLPQSPVPDESFYYPPVPPMPGIHLRYGMGAAFAGQHPVMYNNNTPQLGPNQTYYSPNSPQYSQPMMVGQQRPVLFMPPSPYQPEMPYKGRDSY